jgi:hypothetical protein
MIFSRDNMIFYWIALGTAIFEEIEIIKGVYPGLNGNNVYQQEQ